MARKRKNGTKSPPEPLVIHPNAAGIDIGATEIFVAVPADRDEAAVQSFPTFTQDLNALADWLQRCGITTVAMESTGVYWIPLFQILETRGFEVCLVNAHHAKNVPGRRTDVSDCQWLQYLHSVRRRKSARSGSAPRAPSPEWLVLRSARCEISSSPFRRILPIGNYRATPATIQLL
jgi:transposase